MCKNKTKENYQFIKIIKLTGNLMLKLENYQLLLNNIIN